MEKPREAEEITQTDLKKGRCASCNRNFGSWVLVCDHCFHVFCCQACVEEHSLFSDCTRRDLVKPDINAMKSSESCETQAGNITEFMASDISTNQVDPDWKQAQIKREWECDKSAMWRYMNDLIAHGRNHLERERKAPEYDESSVRVFSKYSKKQ